MLYFLKQTFNMHESHINSFLTHFPFICYNDTNFRSVHIPCANGYITSPPLTLTSFKAMDKKLKYAWLLKIKKCGFVTGKDNFDCIEVTIHTMHRQQTS